MRQLILITVITCCCAVPAGACHDCGPYYVERGCGPCGPGPAVIYYSQPGPPPYAPPPPPPYPYMHEGPHFAPPYPPAGFNFAFGYSSGHGHGRGHGGHHGGDKGYSFSIGGFGIGR